MVTVAERIDYTRRQKGLTYEDLAKLIGNVGGDAIRKAIKRNNLKDVYINVLAEKLHISRDWVLTGEGDMFSRAANHIENVTEYLKSEAKQSLDSFMEAEYLPVTAQAGYLSSLQENHAPDLLKMLLPKEFDKGNYMVVDIEGDSMDDGTTRAICDGDRLLVKELDQTSWNKTIPFRQFLFVIVSREGIVCKQIVAHDVDNRSITCHSFNKMHQDYDINLDDIYKIYYVKKIVERRIKF